MISDASHRQVIEKFSFIYTLTLSGTSDRDCTTRTQHTNRQTATEEGKPEPERDLQSDLMAALTPSATPASQVDEPTSSLVASNITSNIDTQWYQTDSPSDNYSLDLSEIIKFSETEAKIDNSRQGNYLGKILFALACGYLILALWWLFGSRSGQFFAMLSQKQQIYLTKSDAEFIEYMERSLATIDREHRANHSQKAQTQGKSEEIVYLPVYTPAPATPPHQTIPSVPEGSIATFSIPTIPQPAATPEPSPPYPSVAKIPAPPPLPPPTPLPTPAPPESSPAATTSVPQPTIKQTLVGIVELGDNKSAALFQAQGITKQIWLGEEINDSGWVLESVSEQTAKISYQGKIRSLRVGETF